VSFPVTDGSFDTESLEGTPGRDAQAAECLKMTVYIVLSILTEIEKD
jgi:hypothetical protein